MRIELEKDRVVFPHLFLYLEHILDLAVVTFHFLGLAVVIRASLTLDRYQIYYYYYRMIMDCFLYLPIRYRMINIILRRRRVLSLFSIMLEGFVFILRHVGGFCYLSDFMLESHFIFPTSCRRVLSFLLTIFLYQQRGNNSS